MQLSDKGLAFLEAHEGVVLKAYRCPAGIWTIGAGLTSASGVVKVQPGMVISRQEASRLLRQALHRNYEPRVAKAMPGAAQHEFDAGASFDFNTGAIHKATWVKRWRGKAEDALIKAGLLAWNKGGGRVLPGLKRRREEEAFMLLEGRYIGVNAPLVLKKSARPESALARWGLALDGDEISRIRDGFRKLGYDPGPDTDGVIMSAAVTFQADHDLKADGIIGRATLSTLQRRLDASSKSKTAAAAPAAAGAGSATDSFDAAGLPPGAEWLILAAACLFTAYVAWRYRDVVAAKVQGFMPRTAAFLRSF
jgi:lysozyme